MQVMAVFIFVSSSILSGWPVTGHRGAALAWGLVIPVNPLSYVTGWRNDQKAQVGYVKKILTSQWAAWPPMGLIGPMPADLEIPFKTELECL